MIYHLPTFNHFWNLTDFRNFWPRVTFVDLVIPFFEKLTSRASFSYTIYPLSKTFENWPFFGIFDLRWPLLTSWPLFWKAYVKSVILIYNFPSFNDFWNLTLNDPKFEIYPKPKIALLEIISKLNWLLWGNIQEKCSNLSPDIRKTAKIVDFRKNDPVWPRVT